ncbi:MAG: hypothetical protein HY711_06585 [Candidatus Melainabacteria bacterium]|nr:hypothetical protein [Candidatus Melainabacteria bacterium]
MQNYPYYISYVLELLRDRFSQSEMRRQGLRVYTNLDPVAQEAGETILGEAIKKAPKGVSQGALVSVTVQDGAVLAIVGGVGNFWKNQWNRATNPHTVGSSFKPFVYLTALIKRVITPDSLVEDEPLVIKQPWGLPDYAPKNFDKRFLGKITVHRALALSRNVCAVRVAQKAGMDSVVETARLAGIQAKLDPNLSLALGSSAVSPLEMAGAYATFARGGVAIRPQVLRRIENNKGQIIELFETKVDKSFEAEPTAQLVSMLQEVVTSGTGTQARLVDRPVAGKTGTADESKDIWFIGFTPDLVTAVWGGNDDNLPIPGTYVTGGTVMAKIWRLYNEDYYKQHPMPPGSFIAPAKVPEGESQGQTQKIEDSGKFPAPDLAPSGLEGARETEVPSSGILGQPGNEPPPQLNIPKSLPSNPVNQPGNTINLVPPNLPRQPGAPIIMELPQVEMPQVSELTHSVSGKSAAPEWTPRHPVLPQEPVAQSSRDIVLYH